MSAIVLRELVAKLGFAVDDKGFKKAAAGVERIKAAVKQADAGTEAARKRMAAAATAAAAMGQKAAGASKDIGQLAGAASKLQTGLMQLGLGIGIGAVIKKVIGLASDANETDNVLNEVFGAKAANRVREWSDVTSEAMGRSKYTLRENAAALGAMIEPMTGSQEKAQEMAQALGGLAVDLGSFFNASDEEALDALKSGITGMAVPLHKFGIVMNEVTLQEYALTKGIKTKVSAMNVAALTDLRFGFIMSQTSKAQGDAHRTIDGFANASKKLSGDLKDLGTDVGQKLLPVAGKLLVWGGKAVSLFLEFSKKSYIVESALMVLAGGFAVLKWEAIAALAAPLAAFAALVLAVDELVTMFSGGRSFLGDFLDRAFGIGTTDKVVRGVKDVIEWCKQLPGLGGMWQRWSIAVDAAAKAVDRLIKKLVELALSPVLAPLRLAGSIKRAITGEKKDAEGQVAGRGLSDAEPMSIGEGYNDDIAQGEARFAREEARRKKDEADTERARGLFRPDRPDLQLPGGSVGQPGGLNAPLEHRPGYGVLALPDEPVSTRQAHFGSSGGTAASRDPNVRFGQTSLSAPVPPAGGTAITNNVTNTINMPIPSGFSSPEAAVAARRLKAAADTHLRATKAAIDKRGR